MPIAIVVRDGQLRFSQAALEKTAAWNGRRETGQETLLRRAFELLQRAIDDRRRGAALLLAELDPFFQASDRFLHLRVGLFGLRGRGVMKRLRGVQDEGAWLSCPAGGDSFARMRNRLRDVALLGEGAARRQEKGETQAQQGHH